MRYVLPMMLLVVLAGCASGNNVPDGPPPFKEGYVDGCRQGYFDGGYQIATPYVRGYRGSDAAYAAGWEQGHARCYALQLAAPQTIGVGHGGMGP